MKYIIVFLLLLSGVAYGQTTYFIRADTTKLQKVGASNELVILNDTRDTLGALVNIGGGKTAFQRGRTSGDTLFLGRDTIIGIGAGGSAFTPALTPPQITSDENNYNPTGLAAATVLRLDADAAWSITGLESGVDGRVVILHNIGAETITLPSEDGGSSAANQFLLNQSVVLAPNTSVLLRYDGTSSRWRDAATHIATPLLFARTDARNETGAAMAFSAAGERFDMDSVAGGDINYYAEYRFIGHDGAPFNISDDAGGEVTVNGGGVSLVADNGTNVSNLNVDPTYLQFISSVTATNAQSVLEIVPDSILIKPYQGILNIDTLNHVPNPGTYKMMVWDSATGRVATRLLTGAALTNPMTTTGDIIYSSDGSGTPARLGIGTSGQVLAVSAGGIPEWVTGGGSGTVTSVALASGTSGTDVNISGSPITTSGTITLNIPDASATARGLITTGSQTIAGNKTLSGTTSLTTAIFSSALTSSPSGTSVANLGVIGAGASAAISGSQFQVEGSTNTNLRLYMYGSTATTLGVGNNYGTVVIGASTLTEAASGTHPLLASVILKAPTITGGSATVTNTATLYIEGAPSATVSGVNTALYVAAGGVRFGGIGGAGMVQSDADGDLSVTTFTALTTYTPTLTGIGNVTALTAYATNYIRMGNMFWIFGEVEIEPTSTGGTSFGFSLPVSTDVVNSFEWAGTASDALGNVYKIFGDIANERVTFESFINSATTQKLSFTIMGKFIAP